MTAAALPRARELPAPRGESSFRHSSAALVLAALCGPVWNVVVVPSPGVSITAGRALLAVAAVLLALDARRAARPLTSPPTAVWVLLGSLAALWAWAAVSAVAWGCRCAGDLAGLGELVALIALVALAATFEPRLRPALLLAIVAGAAVTALMTLAGVDGLSAGTRSPFPELERLSGPYGNPNFLAFAIGFAIPAGLAACRACGPRLRLALRGALVLVGVVLLLTYSRAGLLAAAAGAVVVLVLVRPAGSRERRRAIAAIAAAAAVAAVAYPVFVEQRRDASSASLDAELRAQDRSGWDASTQGLIPGEPTRMSNPSPGVLAVRADGPGQGVSRPLGVARAGATTELRFEARAQSGRRPLYFGLEDNTRGNGPAFAATTVDERWRAQRLRWRPAADSPDARLYVWAPTAGAGFEIRGVMTIARAPGDPAVTTAISPALLGTRAGEVQAARARVDRRDVRSRRVGVELSLDAFAAQPLRGIGWGRFQEYSSARSEFFRLPTHNEYLRVLAELGIVGTALLALAGLTAAVALRGGGPLDAMGVALVGILVTAAVGLAFVNALSVVAIAAPLGIAAALACARAGPRAVAAEAEATAWWPARASAPPSLRDEWAAARGQLVRAWRGLRGGRPAWRRLRSRWRGDAARALPALARPARAAAAGLAHVRGAGRALRAEGGRALAHGGAVRANVGGRAEWAGGVGAIALATRLPLMLERHAIVPGGDSAQYALLARTFLDQGPVSVVRPPGYPLFLAVAGLLPGRMEDGAVVAQLLLGAGLCAAIVYLAWPLFGRLAAIVAGLLLALTAPFLSMESLLLADMPFGLLVTVVAGLLTAAALAERRRTAWLVAAALAIACATYVKPVGHVLVLAPLLPLALATRSWRATLLGSATVVAVVALLTAPWMARNDARHGSFTMSAQSGITLFNRVFERDRIAIPANDPVGRVAARVRREHPERRLSSAVAEELLRSGDSLPEAERRMRAVAVEAARREPVAFAAGTLRLAHAAFDDVAAGDGEAEITAFVTGEPLPAVTRLGLSVGDWLLAIWRFFALFGLVAVLWLASRSRATRVAAGAAIGVCVPIAIAVAATHGGLPRYSASLAPLTFLLGAAGLSVVVKVGLQLLGIGTGRPRPPLAGLVRNAATPSAAADAGGR